MNTSELLRKFASGDALSDKELQQLDKDLTEISNVLGGKGDMFYAVAYLVNYKLSLVKDILLARGLTSK